VPPVPANDVAEPLEPGPTPKPAASPAMVLAAAAEGTAPPPVPDDPGVSEQDADERAPKRFRLF
jgi:uncharacterized membrane-anchored protein